jgi:uridine nucleosidase
MMPINVSNTVSVTQSTHSRILSSHNESAGAGQPSKLRHTLSTLAAHFIGGVLHDPLTVAYISCPSLFTSSRYRVDVELSGTHTSGETVVDTWNRRSYDDSWGLGGKNCLVANSVNVTILVNDMILCS